jgi:thiol:disulfide interchange protein DsbC
MTDRASTFPLPDRPRCMRRLAVSFAAIAASAIGLSPLCADAAPSPGPADPPPAPPPAAAAPAAPAAPAATVPAQYAALAAKLQKQFPEYSIDSIRPSAVEGIVEVLFGGNRIIYSDTAGTHFFNGHLFDLDAHRDLTDERLEEVTRIDVRQLPLKDAFNVVHGNGKREIYLFEDPDCPYCRKLEEQLPKVNDVTFHVFLFPLTALHPHAYEHALGIWCSKDRAKAWTDKMLKGIDSPPAKCDNPLDRNIALGDKLHVDGTPTLILANGRPHSGTLTAEELERLLASVPAH